MVSDYLMNPNRMRLSVVRQATHFASGDITNGSVGPFSISQTEPCNTERLFFDVYYRGMN